MLTHIKGNWRYKVFRYGDKIYILDGSTYFFSLLLPILTWYLLPINGYEINDTILEELEEVHSVKKLDIGWGIIFTIIALSSIFAKLVHKIVSNFSLPENFNIIYLYIIPAIFIGYFTISRCFKKIKLLSLLNEEYNKKRIRFRLSFKKYVGKDLLFPLLSVVILLLIGSIFDIKKIITKNASVRNYLTYFLDFFIWFNVVMMKTMLLEHIPEATVIIEEK